MPHILKNEILEIHIDLPNENYRASRFDWTGKIQAVTFNNIPFSTTEKNGDQDENYFGKGFYNEFGIETALGFEEAKIGEWFHKIGIGLLKKNESEYFFHKEHEIKPAIFTVITKPESLIITCESKLVQGFSYFLTKEIKLTKSGFIISYRLKNTGEKDIQTDEYVHNFISINGELIDNRYVLRYPFKLNPTEFGEFVDPEKILEIGQDQITFIENPSEQFFISHLAGKENVNAFWEIIHLEHSIGIRERVSFNTQKVNLWGWKHVISPELFHHIHLKPSQSAKWDRVYDFFETD